MEKIMTASEAIRLRRSIRKFKAGAIVSDEQVRQLLEAAMMAPSACNCRPWEFIVIRDRETLDKIAKVHPYAKMLAAASLAIIVCALPDAQKGIATGYFPEDCAIVSQNILIEATAIGLGSCWCGVYPRQERVTDMRSILGLEDRPDIIPFNVIVIGIADESPGARGFYDPEKVRYI